MYPDDWQYDVTYDGGDKSCSTLICDLLAYFKTLSGSPKVCVRALDSGAGIDIPAWCWSTGNALLIKQHPFYLIQKKSESGDNE